MPKLICLSGMNKGEVYQIVEGDNAIGRGESNQIRIFDKKSSRNHCKIVRSGDSLAFVDLNSTNGSKINNVFITGSRPLTVGDHIHIGQTVFLVSGSAQKEKAPEAPRLTPEQSAAHMAAYDILLQRTAFLVTETTTIRRLKKDKMGRKTGYLASFQVDTEESDEQQQAQ